MTPGIRHPGSAPSTSPARSGHHVERRVFIAAPPRVVWAALHDPRSAAGITPELRLGAPDGAWPAAGATRSGRIRLGMLSEPVVVESLEARPTSRYRYRVDGDDFHAEWTWTLEPRSGGTVAVHAADGELTDRLSGFLAGLRGDPVARTVEAHLRRLKLAAEASDR